MTSILLIYPYFRPRIDRSVFRFPPLGVSYIAASLLEAGHEVQVLDCTFLSRKEALKRALEYKAEVVGIYCMVGMVEDCMRFAKHLRPGCRLLVAGGPLPTCEPNPFLSEFDVVVRGEGEQTIQELVHAHNLGGDFHAIAGIVYRQEEAAMNDSAPGIVVTAQRPFQRDIDRIPFPARHLLPNGRYIRHGKKHYGYSITTIMSTRGCPYDCEFCSNVIFGGSYRARSPENVVDEIEDILNLGYDRVAFADDLFTLSRKRVSGIIEEMQRRKLRIPWECLARVDTIDASMAVKMKQAGCIRIYFGIESGSDQTLELMNKKITSQQARQAVEICRGAGLEVGAFFILYYPGDNDETVLNTLRFATDLPLDYLGLSLPFILPGTALHKRVEVAAPEGLVVDGFSWASQAPLYDSEFSRTKLRLAVLKGQIQFKMRKHLGRLAPLFIKLFEKPTDVLIKLLK